MKYVLNNRAADIHLLAAANRVDFAGRIDLIKELSSNMKARGPPTSTFTSCIRETTWLDWYSIVHCTSAEACDAVGGLVTFEHALGRRVCHF